MKSYSDRNRKYNIALGAVTAALVVVLTFIVVLIVTSFRTPKTAAEQQVLTPTPGVTNALQNDNSATQIVSSTQAQAPQDPAQTTQPQNTGTVPATQAQVTDVPTTQATVVDPSTWSTQEIINYTMTAVNNTKAYTGTVSCHHSEGLDGGITNITGGSIVQGIANRVISSIAAPSNETVNFSGGVASNSKGEQMSMLLPNNKQFYLDSNGVASASAVKNGENIDVTITLISESVDKNTAPTYNSNTIGFLDIGSLDIDSVTIETANVTYSGSTMQFSIMPNGYVKSAVYKMPIHIEGTGKASIVSASLVLDGVENESFDFQW